MKPGIVLIALALVSISASCGLGAADQVESKAETQHKFTVSGVRNPTLVVGDTATTTKGGNTLTVLSYESPLSVKGAKPDPDSEFSAIEVKGCDGPSSGRDLMAVGPNAFTLRFRDGISVQPEGFGEEMEVKQPDLRTMNPSPGGCETGFVTFQTPRGEKPELVVFDEQFVLKSAIAWKVPAAILFDDLFFPGNFLPDWGIG